MKQKKRRLFNCIECGKLFSESLYARIKICSIQCNLKVESKGNKVIIPIEIPVKKKEKKRDLEESYQRLKTEVRSLRKKLRKKPRQKSSKVVGFYQSKDWLALRYQVLKVYGRKCMLCQTTNGVMHVDHIIPRSLKPSLALSFENLQVLCEACNLGKSNKDKTDFRPKN